MHEDSTKIWRTLVKMALLGTTGYMTWQALTRLMGADAWLVSALGLVAFEGGLLLWPMYYQQADTNTQSGIAAVMAVIDLLGVAMAFGVEVMGNNPGMAGLIPQFADVATWGVIGVVIANVAAYIVVDAIDPDKQLARQMAAQVVRRKQHNFSSPDRQRKRLFPGFKKPQTRLCQDLRPATWPMCAAISGWLTG